MSAADRLAFCRLTGESVLAMRACGKPVIAAVNGLAAGGGAALALGADIRIATPAAKMGFLFPRVGLSGADMGVTWLLPRIIGLGRATELLMTGRFITAETAEAWGLYNQVVPEQDLMSSAQEMLRGLIAGPRFALSMTKRMLDQEASLTLASAMEAEAQAQQICMTTPDFAEAHNAFMAGRPPKFDDDACP